MQESSKVGEENAALQQQLADIQTSLHQLTQANQASLADAQVPLLSHSNSARQHLPPAMVSPKSGPQKLL